MEHSLCIKKYYLTYCKASKSNILRNISVASRKNHVSDDFFKMGFMPYFLSSNSPLSSSRDRNYESAFAVLN